MVKSRSMLNREKLRVKIEHIIKELEQINKDLVLDESEKEALLDEAEKWGFSN